MIAKIKDEIQVNEYKNEDAATVANVFFYSATGTIGDKGFHIEFPFGNLQEAQQFADILAVYDMFPKLITRTHWVKSGAENGEQEKHGRPIVYLKSGECICNLLALIGAKKSLMHFHSELALRALRNQTNRRINCDTANLRRQVDAAAEQNEILSKLVRSEEFKNLSDKLRHTAHMRLEHPDASYEELGAMLGITKSGLVNRLSKLLRVEW